MEQELNTGKKETRTILEVVKEAIEFSGFPLEMIVGNIFDELGWSNSIGNTFKDFETKNYIEYDVHASKVFKGVEVNIYIECKKSSKEQIVLYCPEKSDAFADDVLTTPAPELIKLLNFRDFDRIMRQLSMVLFQRVPAKTLIVTNGKQISQDNLKYHLGINKLIKAAYVESAAMPFQPYEMRRIHIFILIFDGHLFTLSYLKEKPHFHLEHAAMGTYEFQYDFSFNRQQDEPIDKFYEVFGNRTKVEIMKPSVLRDYIVALERVCELFDESAFEGWGRQFSHRWG